LKKTALIRVARVYDHSVVTVFSKKELRALIVSLGGKYSLMDGDKLPYNFEKPFAILVREEIGFEFVCDDVKMATELSSAEEYLYVEYLKKLKFEHDKKAAAEEEEVLQRRSRFEKKRLLRILKKLYEKKMSDLIVYLILKHSNGTPTLANIVSVSLVLSLLTSQFI
jgi:hypothetical protein